MLPGANATTRASLSICPRQIKEPSRSGAGPQDRHNEDGACRQELFCGQGESGNLRQSRLERFEPLKAVGGVTPVLNADLRGQKPMRRFRSPQGPALRAGQFSAAALWQAPCGKEMKGMRNRAFATVPPQKTPSEAPHRLLLADPRRTNRRLSALLSAFLSVSKYGAVKLFESSGRAGGLPM